MRSLRHPLIFLPSRLSDIYIVLAQSMSSHSVQSYYVRGYSPIETARRRGLFVLLLQLLLSTLPKKTKTSYWKLTANICYILRIDFFSLARHSLGQALPGEEVRFCNRIKILFYLFLFKHFILPRENFHCLVYDFYMFQ